MKSVPLRTLTLLLLTALAAMLLLAAPAVADSGSSSQSSEVTLTVCEVAVVTDSSAQDIVFTMDGESGTTSAFVAKGGAVTIEVASIPFGKNLIVSHEGEAVLTSSGLTIIVSDIQSDLVTVTMKLASAVQGDRPISTYKSHIALVGEDGGAKFTTHDIIYLVTVPEKYAGEKIAILDRASVKADREMDVYHQADIKHSFNLTENETALVHFKIPFGDLKAEGLGADDACLYHYSSDAGWTKLPTVYNVSGDTVFYESIAKADGSFAVVFEEGSATPKDGSEPISPPTGVVPCKLCYPCIVILLVVLLAGIGAAVILRRRKNVEKQ